MPHNRSGYDMVYKRRGTRLKKLGEEVKKQTWFPSCAAVIVKHLHSNERGDFETCRIATRLHVALDEWLP